jgi:hypothetical protein
VIRITISSKKTTQWAVEKSLREFVFKDSVSKLEEMLQSHDNPSGKVVLIYGETFMRRNKKDEPTRGHTDWDEYCLVLKKDIGREFYTIHVSCCEQVSIENFWVSPNEGQIKIYVEAQYFYCFYCTVHLGSNENEGRVSMDTRVNYLRKKSERAKNI